MRLAPALLVTGLGAIGLYGLAGAVAEHQAARRRGERELTLQDAPTGLGADLAAFGIAMGATGVAISNTPTFLRELFTMLGD